MRNSLRFIFILSVLLSNLQAQHVRWFSEFDKAHKEALIENKNLLVLLIEKDSIKSQETIVNSFMNQEYIENINTKFIPVLIIKDQKSSYPIEMLYTLEYPSLFILDKQELFVCEPIRGEISPSKLNPYLEKCAK